LSIGGLREDGVEPMSIASLAVLHGTSENVTPCQTLAELATHFDPATVSKSAAKFDPDELVTLNRSILHGMDFKDAQDRLGAHGVSGERAEEFWNAVRGNLDRLQDAAGWWRIVRDGPHDPVEFSDEDIAFIHSAFDLLPEEPWDRTTWKSWTAAVREATGRKGKALFTPQDGNHRSRIRTRASRSASADRPRRHVRAQTLKPRQGRLRHLVSFGHRQSRHVHNAARGY
jgi:glutamyl-tRNA synthetase